MALWEALAFLVVAAVVAWLVGEVRSARQRLDLVERFIAVGPTGEKRELTHLERQLHGLRSSWGSLEVQLDMFIEGLRGFSLGMSQEAVEAEVARITSRPALTVPADGGLHYPIDLHWLGLKWGANLTIERGRLVEVFVFAPTQTTPGLRESVDSAIRKVCGEPKPPAQPLPGVANDPRLVAMASRPEFRDKLAWSVPMGPSLVVEVRSAGDDANASVSVRAAGN